MTGDTRSGPISSADQETRESESLKAPYPPSIVDRYLAWVERQPTPTVAFYVLVFVVLGLLANAVTWVGDPGSIGSIDVYRTSLPFYVVFPLALMHYLNAVARRALERFRPALAVSDDRYARFEYELTTLPVAGTWAVLAGSLVFTVAFSAFTPSLAEALTDAPWVAVFDVALYVLVFGAIGVFLYHTFRQLRSVSRIHAATTTVNLFQPAPLYAFSWLTARTGMGLLVLNAYSILTDPATFVNPALLGLVIFAWIVAGAAFVLPLRGIHRLIVLEKRRLLADVNERLEATIRQLYGGAERQPLSGMDQLNQLLAGLLMTRDLVSKLPSWPWDAGAFTRFVSTAVLPIAAAALSASGQWLA